MSNISDPSPIQNPRDLAKGTSIYPRADPPPSLRLDHKTFAHQLRPITRLWAHQYMRALVAGCEASESENWFNIRVLDGPELTERSNIVLEALSKCRVKVEDVIPLNLGWPRTECIIKVADVQSVKDLLSLNFTCSQGFFYGGYKGIPEIEMLISSVSHLARVRPGKPVGLPMDISGIPFHSANLDLRQYLLESINASNAHLGIQSILIKQRHHLSGARMNGAHCEVKVDPNAIHMWDFQAPTKVNLQGWDNSGVPRPELWPVMIEYMDECKVCGALQHYSKDKSTILTCRIHQIRDELYERRLNNESKAQDRKERGKARRKLERGSNIQQERSGIPMIARHEVAVAGLRSSKAGSVNTTRLGFTIAS